ncbi:MAG: hypothetical protein ACRERU_18935 [Methylococcales bacterium]
MSDEALRRTEDPSIDRIILVGERPVAKTPPELVTNQDGPQKFYRPRNNQEPEIFESVNQGLFESIEQQSTRLVEDLIESEAIRQINRYQNGPLIGLQETPDSNSIVQAGETPAALAASEKLCYKLGPRSSVASFSRIAADFRRSGLTPSVKAERVDVETGFMVLYPAAESFEASKANVKKLNDQGLRDVWMIHDGMLRGSISLGFFKTRERAEILRNELEAKQIEAQVQAKLSKKAAYFLLFPWLAVEGELQGKLLESGFATAELNVVNHGNCEP